MGDLGPLEELGDHADHLAAGGEHGVGERRPSARRCRRRRRGRCSRLASAEPRRGGRLGEGRRGARVGAAEHAQPGHRAESLAHGRRGPAAPVPSAAARRMARLGDRSVTSARHDRPGPPGRRRRRRPGPAGGRQGRPPPQRRAAGPTPTRCWPTTWPTPPPAVETARSMLDYGAKGDVEARLTCAFVADAVHDLASRVARPGGAVGRRRPTPCADARAVPGHLPRPGVPRRRWPATAGPRHLDADFELVQDTFRRFADEQDRARRRARPPHERRRPRGHHRRPGRDGRLRPVGARASTAATPRAARASTSAWSSPPRSCRGARSASAARSSPGPRSSPGRWCKGGTEEQKQRVAAQAGHRPRSWPPSPSPSPTSAPTSPASRSRPRRPRARRRPATSSTA